VRIQLRKAGLAALVVCVAGAAGDSEAQFQRIKEHLTEHLAQLPNYTCHETIQRLVRVGSTWRHLDTVDLEVAFAGQKELFAKPGSEGFGEESVEKIVSSGTIGNGALGSHIDSLLSQDGAEFKFAGEEKKEGRKTLRYNLLVPQEKSRFRVRHNGAVGMAGYEGSLWVDAETFDPVRVDFKVNRIPSALGVRLIEESMHYRKLTIGNSEFDLPDRSELAATDDMGTYSLNMVKLEHCREFTSDSVVKYGSPVQGSAARDHQDHDK
jgi:hypothetical protein